MTPTNSAEEPYFSLPFWWVVLHWKANPGSVALGGVFGRVSVYYFDRTHCVAGMLLMFLTGAASYELTRSSVYQTCKRLANARLASVLVIGAFLEAIALTYHESPAPLAPNSAILWGASILSYSLIFCIIALGNDMFGILTSPMARKLGEISYSFYILQFLALWISFKILFTDAKASPFVHCVMAALAGIALVVVSNFTFKRVETPVMNSVKRASRAVSGTYGAFMSGRL